MSIDKDTIVNAKDNSVVLAKFFIDHYKYFVLDRNRDLFLYDNGIYKEVEPKYFDELFLSFLKNNKLTQIWKLNRINEVKRAVYAMGTLPIVEFDAYDSLLCFKNCVLDLNSMIKEELSPKHYFTTMININYEKETDEADNFLTFLKSVFTLNDGSPDQDTIDNVIQIGGYLLYPQNRMEKMFLFLGGGSNGKSVLMLIFKMFFAKENISHLDLNTISSNSLERKRLIKSRLNITTEAKSKRMDAEILKQVISSETMQITIKNKDAVDVTPKTKLMVASNEQPYFNDVSHSIYRRIYPITFKNRFVSEIDYKKTNNPTAKRIFLLKDKKRLLSKIKEEKTKILNMFLKGLNSLRQKKWQLPMSKNSDETLTEYEKSGDSASHFLTEFYIEIGDNIDEENLNEGLTVESILEDYRVWYRSNVSEKALNYSAQSLGRKIKEIWRIERKRRYGLGGKRESYYSLRYKYANNVPNNGDNPEREPDDEEKIYQGRIEFNKEKKN